VGSSLQYRQSLSSLALPYLGAYVTGESNDYSGQAIVEKSKGAAIAVVASYRWAGMLKNVSKSPQELQPVAAVTMPPGGNRLLHQCPRARSGPSGGCYTSARARARARVRSCEIKNIKHTRRLLEGTTFF
jgi:hypothetical protein